VTVTFVVISRIYDKCIGSIGYGKPSQSDAYDKGKLEQLYKCEGIQWRLVGYPDPIKGTRVMGAASRDISGRKGTG
jgi:hypothetical protein